MAHVFHGQIPSAMTTDPSVVDDGGTGFSAGQAIAEQLVPTWLYLGPPDSPHPLAGVKVVAESTRLTSPPHAVHSQVTRVQVLPLRRLCLDWTEAKRLSNKRRLQSPFHPVSRTGWFRLPTKANLWTLHSISPVPQSRVSLAPSNHNPMHFAPPLDCPPPSACASLRPLGIRTRRLGFTIASSHTPIQSSNLLSYEPMVLFPIPSPSYPPGWAGAPRYRSALWHEPCCR